MAGPDAREIETAQNKLGCFRCRFHVLHKDVPMAGTPCTIFYAKNLIETANKGDCPHRVEADMMTMFTRMRESSEDAE
jgi:hypothetical protein